MEDDVFEIELSREAVFSAKKLFEMLTNNALEELGFTEDEIDCLGDLYLEIKNHIEIIEMTEG